MGGVKNFCAVGSIRGVIFANNKYSEVFTVAYCCIQFEAGSEVIIIPSETVGYYRLSNAKSESEYLKFTASQR
jgi:hypothetical protein